MSKGSARSLALLLAMLCSKPSPRFASIVHKGPTKSSTPYVHRHLRKQGTNRAVHVRAQEAEQPATKRVRSVDAEELELAIQERDRPLIIDFSAAWCGPCLMMAKVLEEVAEEFGDDISILTIDTDHNRELSTSLQIQGLPTLIFIGKDKSKPALRTEGLLEQNTIKEIITTELL